MKRNYCSECGRRLCEDKRKGKIIRHCPVHINDMHPVTSKNPIVKEFKSYKGSGW